ncbi:MAG: hypothetical protein R3B96_06910 [Pirellulaceae bacterium]
MLSRESVDVRRDIRDLAPVHADRILAHVVQGDQEHIRARLIGGQASARDQQQANGEQSTKRERVTVTPGTDWHEQLEQVHSLRLIAKQVRGTESRVGESHHFSRAGCYGGAFAIDDFPA